MKKLFIVFFAALLLAGGASGQKQPFMFVQMCDPQLGMGGYEADKARFKQAVKQINELKPAFVVICGDLINTANETSYSDFKAIAAGFNMPCYCAPGNHDVANTPTPETLRGYRAVMGKDYYEFEWNGYAFVVANTSLWKAPLAGESEKQDAWFKQTLEQAAKKNEPIFVVSHYPLYVKAVEETNSYYNLPAEKRQELLGLFERCGVVAHLAGHTHKTITNEFHGIQLVCSQTTSKNFDPQPFGFRLWYVGSRRPFQQKFVALENQ
jgi:3',5'-cyclic AMP phosphodiesterase CpdA